ncbi:MAG: FlgD immunoglobulin-like domain containing protein [Ignavibacteriales bacterium]
MSLRNKIIKLSSPALFLLSTVLVFPQPYQRELNIIPVSDVEGLLNNTFSGGHNNLEHQFIDIDDDGDLDIFYLDSDQTFGWFENRGSKFNADYKYSLTLPEGLNFSNWFYFIDIDNDNDLDYFTSNNDQISFYRNDGNIVFPSFVLAQDTVRDIDGLPIYSEFSCNPIFADVDGDNDYDFISGNSAGTLTYYENIGTTQNYNLKFITNIWQNIIIIGTVVDDPLHGASSIDFVDIDGDSDLDLFWGDFFSKSLYVIENQGSPTIPDMKRVSNIYPVNSDSIFTSGFNMPRFADIDADGNFDLFVSVLYDPTVPQSLMYLKNIGTPQSANHQLMTEDYLKTLDVGNNSSPVFVDIDNDDDLDLFMGSLKNPTGSVNYLENIGNKFAPAFLFIDSAYFNITGDLGITPSFGDIDNDGDFDLLLGKFNGTLSLYINSGTSTSPLFTIGDTLKNNFGQIIDVGSSSVPLLMDTDNDSDLDLIIGGFNGKFTFYENTGNASSFQFALNTLYFDGLDVGDNSTPFLIDYDKNGVLDLFTGNRIGSLYYFRNDGSNLAPIWFQVTDKFIADKLGGNTYPCFADIDNDTDTDLILGNVKGGLYLYINYEISNVDEGKITPVDNFEIAAYPNPFNPETRIRVELSVGQDIKIGIYNLLGEKVKTLYSGFTPAGTFNFNWDAKNNSGITLPAGIYFVMVSSDETRKVIKLAFLK